MPNQIFTAFLLLSLWACGSGEGSNDKEPPSEPPVFTIALDFTRINTDAPNPFRVTATVSKNGVPESGIAAAIEIELGRGSLGAINEVSPGQYQFSVTPTQTGEHSVKVTYKNTTIERTALVLSSVHNNWGQPMAVSGLVNTAGYEDGVTISPDGEYLFVQYGPLYFSALQLFNLPRANGGCEGHRLEYPIGTPNRCTHSWLDNTIGPYGAPERPGFFDGRFAGTTMRHNANSWGVGDDESPIFAPSTMIYGFEHQSDGSFAEPFFLSFDDENDALTNASGLSLMLHGVGTATILFALDDPSDPDWVDLDDDGTDDVQSLHDIYTAEITLGQNNILGTYVFSGTPGTPPVRGTPFDSQLVNFGKTGIDGIAGTQGNPHLFHINGEVQSIWTDDERDDGGDRGDLAVYGLTAGAFPDGAWLKVLLPTVINQPWPSEEIQPFFTGNGLYYTHTSNTQLPEIVYADFTGTQTLSDYQNASNWGSPEKILGTDTDLALGKIIAVGEPTIGNFHGDEYLYFVYAYIRGFDSVSGLPDIDMQAGYIRKQSP
jgi:hypothetical protein